MQEMMEGTILLEGEDVEGSAKEKAAALLFEPRSPVKDLRCPLHYIKKSTKKTRRRNEREHFGGQLNCSTHS